MSHAAATLEALGVPYETRVVSAHRTPDLLFEYASTAEARGLEVIIAGAGGAAHLPGMTAAKTTLPVLGVPVRVAARSRAWTRCCRSCRCRPASRSGTMAIGRAGAVNAALLAAASSATSTRASREALKAHRGASRRRTSSHNPNPRQTPARHESRHPRRRSARPHAGAGRLPSRPAIPLLRHHAGRLRRRRSASCRSATSKTRRRCSFRRGLDAVTFEWENVPVEAARDAGGALPFCTAGRGLACRRRTASTRRRRSGSSASRRPRFAAIDSRRRRLRGPARDGAAGHPQDAPGRLRRQGPGLRAQRRRAANSRRRSSAAGAADPRIVRALRARAVDHRGARSTTARPSSTRWSRTTTATASCA